MSDNPTIFLVGFMGSGKTEAGRALSLLLGRAFVDLDALIEQQESRTIGEIFTVFGEQEFRRLETEAIESVSRSGPSVVALGGGACQSQENRDLLAAAGTTVWLDCPFEVCFARVKGDKSRPLLGEEAETRQLFDRRRESYGRADYVVEAGSLAPEEIAMQIVAALSEAKRS